MKPIREHFQHTSNGKQCIQTRDYPTGERTVRTVERKDGSTSGLTRTHWTAKKR